MNTRSASVVCVVSVLALGLGACGGGGLDPGDEPGTGTSTQRAASGANRAP